MRQQQAADVDVDASHARRGALDLSPHLRLDLHRVFLGNHAAIQRHGRSLFGQDIPALGTPLYTDARLYARAGIPAAVYGAGPRTVLESNAKRADERLELEDLRRATKVIARTVYDLLAGPPTATTAGP
jgi:hypothetical protein